MRTIYDYKDIRKFEQSLLSEELSSGVIVTATSSLAAALRAYYPEYIVIGMHELICELIPEWDESTKDLRNYISLRNSLDNYAAENGDDAALLLSLQRNATDMWNAILLLVEADVYPQDIPEHISTPVKHFKRIWRQLEIENSTLLNLRAQFAFRLSDEETIVSGIKSCIGRAYKDIDFDAENRRFFLLGFYFITPLQARIIDVLTEADIDIAYLNCFDARYKRAGEIWGKTFEEEYSCNASIDIQPDISFDNRFGDFLNGKDDTLDADITKCSSALEFAQAMREPIQSGASIFTPDLKNCEKILKEYYPEYFERKHLLAFPVGQYIYYLHMMWNDMHGRLEMRFDYVFKCFATGWLEVDQLNGRDYVYELSKLETYFKDCITLDDWRGRFRTLKNAKKGIENAKTKGGPNERWHVLLGNPFRQLSVFSLSYETIGEMERLLSKLIEDAELLFSSTGKIRISDHFAKITEIINRHLDREDILDDEVQIAKELVRNLEMSGAQDQDCPLNAIKDAIMLLIGGHFDEVDTLDQEISLIEERIAPLSMVESSILSNYGEDIYLVLADEFTLPGRQRDLPWPLSDELLDSLQIKGRDDTKRYVTQMRSVIKNRPLSYRYLFFSFVFNVNEENHPRLHINWITNQNAKTASASPYVLMMRPDVRALEDRVAVIDFEEEISKVQIEDTDIDVYVEEPSEDVPDIVWMDYELCEYRYLYSYLLNFLPEYKSDFHYPFLLTKLIKTVYSQTGKSLDDAADMLFKVFPFFRNVEHRQAFDYTGNGLVDGDPIEFDDIQYAAGGLDVHFIEAKKMALRGRVYKYEREDRCMYCPYSYVCIFKDEKING